MLNRSYFMLMITLTECKTKHNTTTCNTAKNQKNPVLRPVAHLPKGNKFAGLNPGMGGCHFCVEFPCSDFVLGFLSFC